MEGQVLLMLSLFGFSNSLTCIEIEERGSGSAMSPEELQLLAKMDSEEIERCIIILGKEPLSANQSSIVWKSLISVFGSAGDIPEDCIRQLGWIVNGIPPSHFKNISLSDIDTIESLGKCKELTSEQLAALRDSILDQWMGKDMEDLTNFDLIALNQIICSFNSTLIQLIHPLSYKDAAWELSTLSNCPNDVMKELANLATNPASFGNPEEWTSVHIANVGCVIVGLPSIRILRAEAMEGLTPAIIECLPPLTLQSMSVEQISRLSPGAAGAVSAFQKSSLSSDQKYALSQALAGTDKSKNKASEFHHKNILFLIIFLLILIHSIV